MVIRMLLYLIFDSTHVFLIKFTIFQNVFLSIETYLLSRFWKHATTSRIGVFLCIYLRMKGAYLLTLTLTLTCVIFHLIEAGAGCR